MKFFLILLLVCFTSYAKNIASVKLIRGKAYVLNEQKVKKKLAKGDWLSEGDTIETEKRSFVRLNFIDDSKINVGPSSKIKIERFKDDKPGVLSVVTGKIRAEVSKDYLKMKKNKSKLFVKSNAAVMGIRGTDFLFSKDEKAQETKAVLFRGSVVFNKLNESDVNNYDMYEGIVDKGFKLRPGDFSIVKKGANSPTKPKAMDRKQLIKLKVNKNLISTSSSSVPKGLSANVVNTENPSGIEEKSSTNNKPINVDNNNVNDASVAKDGDIEQIPLPAGVNYRPPSFLNDSPIQRPGDQTNKRRIDINLQDQ